MLQVMLDLETMSTKSNAAIVSIGAVLFSKDDGLLDYNDSKNTQITTLNMPYSMGLYLHEIESMHIQVKLESN